MKYFSIAIITTPLLIAIPVTADIAPTKRPITISAHHYLGVTDEGEMRREVGEGPIVAAIPELAGYHVWQPKNKPFHRLQIWMRGGRSSLFEIYLFCVQTNVVVDPGT